MSHLPPKYDAPLSSSPFGSPALPWTTPEPALLALDRIEFSREFMARLCALDAVNLRA